MHAELFSGLPDEDRRLVDGALLGPGGFRERQVAVGRHEAPLHSALPHFLASWQERYGRVRRGEASLVALAAAHHRLAWMHPFLDGNGRVTRLHTHLGLHAWGLTSGLWSPLRGFARSADQYKQLLQAADEHRRGDLDGRGNLTPGVRSEALNLLHFLFSTQHELPRADAKAMLGMGDWLATSTVSALLARGFLASDSAFGKLRFAVPRHALRFYFPLLWPEAEQDQDLLDGKVESLRASARTRAKAAGTLS